jgi:glucose-induced degradation protein 8
VELANANNATRSDINALILDYLTMAGYPNAAKKFSAEANLPPQQVNDSIEARQQIQTAIHRGDIAEAISNLNDLDPEVCRLITSIRVAPRDD